MYQIKDNNTGAIVFKNLPNKLIANKQLLLISIAGNSWVRYKIELM